MGDLRSSVAIFAHHMEQKLQENDHKGCWHRESPESLLKKLREEVEELAAIVAGKEGAVYKEAADVANFAMMVAEVISVQRAAKQMQKDGW